MAYELTDDLKSDVWSLFESGVLSEEVTRDFLGDRSFETRAEKACVASGPFWTEANRFLG